MLDATKLNGNFNNLNGLLLIKAQEAITGKYYFSVASQESETFFGFVKHLYEMVDKSQNEELDQLIKNAEKQDKLTGHGHDLEIFGVDISSESNISNRIFPQTEIDIYDFGFVLNPEEYEESRHKIALDYFFAYNQQQAGRDY